MQLQGSFQAAMDEVTYGIRLDRGLEEAPLLAQALGNLVVIYRAPVQVRFEQAEPSLIGPGRRYETRACQMCRGNTRQGTPARMQPLRPSALLEEYLDTRGGAGGDALDSDELVLRQAEQLSRCERGAEMGHNTGRMKARVMKTSLDRRTDSDGGLDADHIGGENIVPRRVELLADGKRGRQSHDARMHDARWMRVVVVQPVHEQAIGESGIARSEAALVSDHGALTGPGGRNDSGQRRSRVGLRMRGEREPQGIERVQTGFLAHFGRQ